MHRRLILNKLPPSRYGLSLETIPAQDCRWCRWSPTDDCDKMEIGYFIMNLEERVREWNMLSLAEVDLKFPVFA